MADSQPFLVSLPTLMEEMLQYDEVAVFELVLKFSRFVASVWPLYTRMFGVKAGFFHFATFCKVVGFFLLYEHCKAKIWLISVARLVH